VGAQGGGGWLSAPVHAGQAPRDALDSVSAVWDLAPLSDVLDYFRKSPFQSLLSRTVKSLQFYPS
jgi:hypothetical protein